jgi:phospholipase/carboxylesterase
VRHGKVRETTIAKLHVRVVDEIGRNGTEDGPIVVLLHGFGAPGDDLVSLSRALDAPPNTRFVFPEGPIELGHQYSSGRAWWRIDLEQRLRRQERGERQDIAEVPEGLPGARASVAALLSGIEAELHPPPGKVVLGGFSQGAMLALDVALHSTHALAGLALMSTTHIAAEQWASRFEQRRGLPVFMSHGMEDALLPFSVAEGLRETLTAQGMRVEWIPFHGGHGIPQRVVEGLSAFLRRTLGG